MSVTKESSSGWPRSKKSFATLPTTASGNALAIRRAKQARPRIKTRSDSNRRGAPSPRRSARSRLVRSLTDLHQLAVVARPERTVFTGGDAPVGDVDVAAGN